MSFTPTVGQIREQVMMKLRLDPADSEMVLYWMNQAYADVSQYSSFYITENEYPLQAGSSRLQLGPGVEMVRQVSRTYGGSTSVTRPAQRVRMEEVLSKLSGDATVVGTRYDGGCYSLSGQDPNEIRYWPVSGSGETMIVEYSGIPNELEEDDETILISEPFGSKILEYGALVEGAKFKKDPLLYDFENTLSLWVDRYIGWLNRRKTVNSTAFEVRVGDRPIDVLERESEH